MNKVYKKFVADYAKNLPNFHKSISDEQLLEGLVENDVSLGKDLKMAKNDKERNDIRNYHDEVARAFVHQRLNALNN